MSANIFRPMKMGKEIFEARAFDEHSFVMDWSMAAGGLVPPHRHQHNDEHFLVTKGEILFVVGGKKIVCKEGEEFTVPRGTFHSVRSAVKGAGISARVTYSPCADTHRLFQITAALDEQAPNRAMNMLKAFYICRRLRLRDFSNPPAVVTALLTGVLTVMGKLSGWDKLAKQFDAQKN